MLFFKNTWSLKGVMIHTSYHLQTWLAIGGLIKLIIIFKVGLFFWCPTCLREGMYCPTLYLLSAYIVFTLLKLCLATAIHNFKWLKTSHFCLIWKKTVTIPTELTSISSQTIYIIFDKKMFTKSRDQRVEMHVRAWYGLPPPTRTVDVRWSADDQALRH